MMRPLTKTVGPALRQTIDAWLAENGGARRFEPGASSELEMLRHFLERRGFRLIFSKMSGYTITNPDRPTRRLDRAGLFRFVDKLRAEEGLQPFMASGVAP